jgi:hypothetical protein
LSTTGQVDKLIRFTGLDGFESTTSAVDKLSFRLKDGTESLFLQGLWDRNGYSGSTN